MSRGPQLMSQIKLPFINTRDNQAGFFRISLRHDLSYLSHHPKFRYLASQLTNCRNKRKYRHKNREGMRPGKSYQTQANLKKII